MPRTTEVSVKDAVCLNCEKIGHFQNRASPSLVNNHRNPYLVKLIAP